MLRQKGLALLRSIVEKVSARVALGSALFTFAASPATGHPIVPVRELTLNDAEVRRYSAKHILKQASPGVYRLAGHTSHRSHASHASHSSHYSSSGGGTYVRPPSLPPAPRPAPSQPAPSAPSARPLYSAPSAEIQPTLSDDFDDNKRTAEKWTIGVAATDGRTFDNSIRVVEVNQRLEITVPPTKSGPRFSGYVSSSQLPLTSSSVQIELVRASGTASAIFAVVNDSENWYGFRVAGGILSFDKTVGGKTTRISVRYDPSVHRFLRLLHGTSQSSAQSVMWQISADGLRWFTMQSATPAIDVGSVTVAISGGAEDQLSETTTVVFDNFQYAHQ